MARGSVLIRGANSSNYELTTPGTAGQVLTSNGPGADPTFQDAGSGSGDVVGPSSATDNAIARFDSTTGKLIQNSGITIADGASGSLSGTNTGDQTITLTGDVTGSGSGSFATTIASDAVTNGKLRNSGGCSVIGRSANTTGDPGDISASADGQALFRLASVVGFVDFATQVAGAGRWEPLTNGNVSAPELLFTGDGDVIMAWVS